MTIEDQYDDDPDLDQDVNESAPGNRYHPKSTKLRPKRVVELLENKRGRDNEKRFKDFIQHIIAKNIIPELIRIKNGTKKQNKQGRTDFRIVFCTEGQEITAYIQIKSSFGGKYWFRIRGNQNKANKHLIHVIVVNDQTTLSHIITEIQKILRIEQEYAHQSM